MVYCTVCLNNNRKNRNLSFFTYPRDSIRRNQWLKAVGREDLLATFVNQKIRQKYRICEDHFARSCVTYSKNGCVKYLSDDAFPKHNLPSNDGTCCRKCVTAASLQGNQTDGTEPAFETQQDHMSLPIAAVKNEPEAEEWVQMTNPEDVLIPDACNSREHQSGSENEKYSIDSPVRKRSRSTIYSNDQRADESKDTALVVTLRDICTQLHAMTDQRDDRFDSFGKYIASMLRSMSTQEALDVQPKIVSLITSAGASSNEGRVSQSHGNYNEH